MKLVFVVGFYDTVLEGLREKYAAHLDAGTLIFIRQAHGKPIPDLPDFSSRLSDLASRCTPIKIILAVLTNYAWLEAKVSQLVDRVKARNPNAQIELLAPPRKEVGVGVIPELIEEIERFGLPAPEAITMRILEKVLGRSRVLCVCMDGKSGFPEALIRAGFPPESINHFFIERCVSPGRNSNLMNVLKEEAKHCAHLVYAWGGLRTLHASVKKSFSGKVYEAPTVAKVIGLFRKWVLGEWERLRHSRADEAAEGV